MAFIEVAEYEGQLPSLESKYGLEPDRQVIVEHEGETYRWFVYAVDEVAVKLVGLQNVDTGIITTTFVYDDYDENLTPALRRTEAVKAWSGARFSRAPGNVWDILRQLLIDKVDSDAKLAETFDKYGHASVADMARAMVHIMDVPMSYAAGLFNIDPTNDGQEGSTRYQPRLGKAVLHALRHSLRQYSGVNGEKVISDEELAGLEKEFQEFGELSRANFSKWREKLDTILGGFFDIQTDDEKSSHSSRILDCARFFTLFGQLNKVAFQTSYRQWARIIAETKASPMPVFNSVAKQIEFMLNPLTCADDIEERLQFKAAAPSLLRHTEADEQVQHNIAELKEYLEEDEGFQEAVLKNINRKFKGHVMDFVDFIPRKYDEGLKQFAQYIMLLYPGANYRQVIKWGHSLPDERKREISVRFLYAGLTNFEEPPVFSAARGLTLILKGFIGELRDLNRHRSMTRFFPLPMTHGLPVSADTAEQILATGYGLPSYLTDIPEFAEVAEEFKSDMEIYYQKLYGYFYKMREKYGEKIDYSFAINLLPLAHQVDLWWHGDTKSLFYAPYQRHKPGGHINYIKLVHQIGGIIADAIPFLEGLRLKEKYNPSDRAKYISRK